MFELAAGDKDKRVFIVGDFGGGQDIGRNDPRPAGFSREAIAEDNRLARMIRCGARIHDRGFPLKPLPRDVVKRRHCELHFGEDF